MRAGLSLPDKHINTYDRLSAKIAALINPMSRRLQDFGKLLSPGSNLAVSLSGIPALHEH